MTPNKVIEQVDKLRPNVYDAETKLYWLSQLEGLLAITVTGQWRPSLTYPDDLEGELWLRPPFDQLYPLYLQVEMERYDQDYGGYNNAAATFNAAYDRFRKHWQRTHMPEDRGGFQL